MRAFHDTDRTRVGTSHSRLTSADHLALAREDTNKSTVSLANTIVQGDVGNRTWFTGNSFETKRDVDFDFDFDLERGQQKGDNVSLKKEPKEQEGNLDLIEWDGPGDPEHLMNWGPVKEWIVTATLGFMTVCGKSTGALNMSFNVQHLQAMLITRYQ